MSVVPLMSAAMPVPDPPPVTWMETPGFALMSSSAQRWPRMTIVSEPLIAMADLSAGAPSVPCPLPPGSGFLRTDTTTLVKFRGAYVSGPCPVRGKRVATPISDSRVVGFEAGYVIPSRPVEPPPVEEPVTGDEESTLAVVVDRLRDAGPPAHRVWLPPLSEPATLAQLLPRIGVDLDRGFGAPYGGLRIPVGWIDRQWAEDDFAKYQDPESSRYRNEWRVMQFDNGWDLSCFHQYLRHERNGRVTVMINIFGRPNPVELDHWQVEDL